MLISKSSRVEFLNNTKGAHVNFDRIIVRMNNFENIYPTCFFKVIWIFLTISTCQTIKILLRTIYIEISLNFFFKFKLQIIIICSFFRIYRSNREKIYFFSISFFKMKNKISMKIGMNAFFFVFKNVP